ncbi:MAG: response regulator [Mucilaginibacter sp.]|nr:response regulator [Mucilaginibacter sp.]
MRKKILILEDNQEIIDILTDWLGSLGYEIAAYTTLSDIIALAQELKPDLVMLDYFIGDINGGEYCHQLKHNPLTRHLSVIMLSAHQRVIDSLGHYGWDAFVAKPFDLEDLARRIKSFME